LSSKVSSDWLPSYIKATLAVLEIFKMDGYFRAVLIKLFPDRLSYVTKLVIMCCIVILVICGMSVLLRVRYRICLARLIVVKLVKKFRVSYANQIVRCSVYNSLTCQVLFSKPPNSQAGRPPLVGRPQLLTQYIRSTWRPCATSATCGDVTGEFVSSWICIDRFGKNLYNYDCCKCA
jgi:hypothetical protein